MSTSNLFSPRSAAAAAALKDFSSQPSAVKEHNANKENIGNIKSTAKKQPNAPFAFTLPPGVPPPMQPVGTHAAYTSHSIRQFQAAASLQAFHPPPPVFTQQHPYAVPMNLNQYPAFAPPPPPAKKAKLSTDVARIAVAGHSSNQPVYQRQDKSLVSLCQRFNDEMKSQPKGTSFQVEQLSQQIGVERRRLFDLINVMEAINMVHRNTKGSFMWIGESHIQEELKNLQQAAILRFPYEAVKNGIIAELPTNVRAPEPLPRSMSSLTKQFVMCFLVGNEALSLARAIEIMEGRIFTETDYAQIGLGNGTEQSLPADPSEVRKLAQKGCKTKIRRLYDISNVLSSIGLIEKMEGVEVKYKKPVYKWNFKVSVKDLLQENSTASGTAPLSEVKEEELIVAKPEQSSEKLELEEGDDSNSRQYLPRVSQEPEFEESTTETIRV